MLLELARQLNHPLAWRKPQEIFQGLAAAFAPFAGWSYETIGSQGAQLALPASAKASADSPQPTAGTAAS